MKLKGFAWQQIVCNFILKYLKEYWIRNQISGCFLCSSFPIMEWKREKKRKKAKPIYLLHKHSVQLHYEYKSKVIHIICVFNFISTENIKFTVEFLFKVSFLYEIAAAPSALDNDICNLVWQHEAFPRILEVLFPKM